MEKQNVYFSSTHSQNLLFTAFEATRKNLDENIVLSNNKGSNDITRSNENNQTIYIQHLINETEQKNKLQEKGKAKELNIIPIIQKRLDNDAIRKALDQFTMIRRKTHYFLPNVNINHEVRTFKNGESNTVEQIPVIELNTIQPIFQPVENDVIKRNLDGFTMEKNMKPNINFNQQNLMLKLEKFKENNVKQILEKDYNINDINNPNLNIQNTQNQFDNRNKHTNLYNIDDNQNDYFTGQNQLKETFESALRKQTELMENFLSVLRKKDRNITTKNAFTDFEDLMIELQKVKIKNNTVKLPVETIVDETEVRKALLNDPYVRRILKMNRENKEKYLKYKRNSLRSRLFT